VTPVATDPQTLRAKATWMAGDFGRIAKSYEQGAAEFVKRLNFGPGARVLDVACGTGNLTIPIALSGARVTGIDLAPNLIDQARAWAMEQDLTIWFEEGDVEEMPYKDGAFDAVVSMFGVMFAPHPEDAAAEMLRVLRPGGRIALANWMADGFVGKMFKIVAKYVPPTAGVPSPLLWGNESMVAERMGGQVINLCFTQRTITFNFPFDVEATVEAFRRYYGPILRAFAALDPDSQQLMRYELEELWSKYNYGEEGTTRVDSSYLEVRAIRK
jgi:SAM-dependent methyltransferase